MCTVVSVRLFCRRKVLKYKKKQKIFSHIARFSFFFFSLSARNSDLSYFYISVFATRWNNYSWEGSKLYHVDDYCDISLHDGEGKWMDLNREEKGGDADYSCGTKTKWKACNVVNLDFREFEQRKRKRRSHDGSTLSSQNAFNCKSFYFAEWNYDCTTIFEQQIFWSGCIRIRKHFEFWIVKIENEDYFSQKWTVFEIFKFRKWQYHCHSHKS